jgi:two-component system, NtrC family, C4-dicarboxylate transport response regulator DctD
MPDNAHVMFVDDEPHIRIAAQQTLELADLRLNGYETAEAALRELSSEFTGVLVCDIRLPGMDGMEFLRRALEIDPELPVVLVTGHGDISMAVGAMHEGAYDFLEKPYTPERLTEVVRRALDKRALTLENRALRRELEEHNTPGPRIIGSSPSMQRLRGLIRQVADADADVLIFGETGTGKELVARSLHELSRRRTGNFVALNCGAMPEQLMESELFGHEAGAFTGARVRRLGKLEHASGGTLFLDEIESMPMAMQVRLLRVLQERSLERLGSNQTVPLDLRVLAATKVDLREAADRGEFREDLYYRLNVVTLEIPPLRNRREDIPLLFQHFALVAGARFGKETSPLTAAQLPTLLAHPWPGNVRELRNAAERYVLLGEQLDFDIGCLVHTAPEHCSMSLREQVEGFERSLIEQELRVCKGNLSEATQALGIPRKTLHDKVVKYGLDRQQYR